MYLNITTTAGCRGRCVFCPQDRFWAAMAGRPALLTPEELTALLPNLRGTRFRAFAFGGFSEPFDNPEILELFEITAAQDFVDATWVHTTGEALDPEMVARISRIRFDVFDVSCQGSGPGPHAKARPFIDEDRVMGNVHHLLRNRENIRQLTISVSGPFMPEAQVEDLRRACERHGAHLDRRDLHDRAGLLKVGRRRTAVGGPFRCGKHDFRKPVLLPGGDLSLCCQDFALEHIIGNLHAMTFARILEESPLRRRVLSVADGVATDDGLSCYRCEFCIPTRVAAPQPD
ncbi:Radical SAM superfamily protein [Aquisphaera giovannonii]|uniref:Radical SAM superfamily protein n=1 Tax=Aquisphaera giovannonii TaxID=406548 RepID=A0A5B9VVZ6_9BACT|nr:radical SAM/SPASM domain-containing protein [Aquisphaera giovannonii]QEH32412.1 Radical SAM superfamily protein [Aquisphaera giovannonii]